MFPGRRNKTARELQRLNKTPYEGKVGGKDVIGDRCYPEEGEHRQEKGKFPGLGRIAHKNQQNRTRPKTERETQRIFKGD